VILQRSELDNLRPEIGPGGKVILGVVPESCISLRHGVDILPVCSGRVRRDMRAIFGAARVSNLLS